MSNNMIALQIGHIDAEELAKAIELTRHGDVSFIDDRRDVFIRLATVDWEGDLSIETDLYETPESWKTDAWKRFMDRFEMTLERALCAIVEHPERYDVEKDWLDRYGENFKLFAGK